MDVLDIGTGAGLLALAAARLGARVTAIDNDAAATATARRNADANGLADRIEVVTGPVVSVRGHRYDITVHNIGARPLVQMAASLPTTLKPNGILLAAGLLADFTEKVKA